MSLLEFNANLTLSQSMQGMRQFSNWLINLVFPPVCGACGRVDYRFCHACLEELSASALPVESANKPIDGIDRLFSSGKYEGKLSQAIQTFKYHGATELAEPLAQRLTNLDQERIEKIDVLIPVPLFANRLAERGYNQSDLLGEYLSADCGIPLRSDCLRRIRDTGQQALMQGEERLDNVRDAFAASDNVRDLSILLIDDVVTTGSTLSECARALRIQGAKAVYALVLSQA